MKFTRQFLFYINRVSIRGDILKKLCTGEADSIFVSNSEKSYLSTKSIFFRHCFFKIVRLEWCTPSAVKRKEKVKNEILVHLMWTSYFSSTTDACLQIPRIARISKIAHAPIQYRFFISPSCIRKMQMQFYVHIKVESFIHTLTCIRA